MRCLGFNVFLIALLHNVMFSFYCFASVSLTLSPRQLCDLELLLNESFAPLKGFLDQNDYNSVVSDMRLANGILWPMPITLDVDKAMVEKLENDKELLLKSTEGLVLARMQVHDVWQPDKLVEAACVYGTTDTTHPGVSFLLKQTKDYYVGGDVTLVNMPEHYYQYY